MSLDWELSISVDTGGETAHSITLGEWNLTYNLSKMINVAYGIRDEDEQENIFDEVFKRKDGRYYDEWDKKTGGEIIEGLEQAIGRMEANPDKYKAYNPPNGWGDYDGALEVLKDFLETCKNHPKGMVSMWR